ncbi:MAG: DNA/RNA nuclease SfsA [Pseudomonadales bacterium]|nr:DNA/RNA nuclease SfsA [Pseudomonadales bacterium]MCP5359014.1 DNA/RNA nuclease SfsA [Pseudomonadales bacterium]
MIFDPPLQTATLIRRYKRFLADVRLPDGSEITLHCPNTGSMRNCAEPGSRVWYSDSGNAARKYPCTWELVEVEGRYKVGINTGRANALVREALEQQTLAGLAGYAQFRAEVPYGTEKSRIDFLLSDKAGEPGVDCYVEVKSVTLGLGDGLGAFPDAVTSRGQKHLRELMEVREAGHRAVLLFCVQHEGIARVRPADEIDPDYGRLLREAHAAGVEVLAYRTSISATDIVLDTALPVLL